MHENNRRWLTELRDAHLAHFHRARVLEIGSRLWSPPPADTIRPFFTECDHVGVDRIPGPGVDIACESHDTDFGGLPLFDTLAIFSVFEHDPTWPRTLAHNLQWLRAGGLFITCFGAEGNLPHLMNWKPVPHREFLDFCDTLPLIVRDAFFEEERYGRDCAGAFNVAAVKLAA